MAILEESEKVSADMQLQIYLGERIVAHWPFVVNILNVYVHTAILCPCCLHMHPRDKQTFSQLQCGCSEDLLITCAKDR